MPVCSYVIHPLPGAAEVVRRAFAALPECEARVSEGGQLLILLTDTADLESEIRLQRALKEVPGVAHMALSFGYTEPENLDTFVAQRKSEETP